MLQDFSHGDGKITQDSNGLKMRFTVMLQFCSSSDKNNLSATSFKPRFYGNEKSSTIFDIRKLSVIRTREMSRDTCTSWDGIGRGRFIAGTDGDWEEPLWGQVEM